jgi:hypothetical protein
MTNYVSYESGKKPTRQTPSAPGDVNLTLPGNRSTLGGVMSAAGTYTKKTLRRLFDHMQDRNLYKQSIHKR